MTTFQLDISGIVSGNFNVTGYLTWDDLSPFAQGYIEALFASEGADLWRARDPSPPSRGPFGFRDLAPETLARIIADCEAAAKSFGRLAAKGDGVRFWSLRQYGHDGFPPLTVQLGDDGKVRFA